MTKFLKIILIAAVVLIILVLGAKFYVQWRFDEIVNGKEDRKYTIAYEDVSLDLTLDGITLKEVQIDPRNPENTEGTMVKAQVALARMEGVALFKILFSDKLQVDNLRFEQPSFRVYLSEDSTRQKKVRQGMSGLFGDIIKSASLKDFDIRNGHTRIYRTRPDTVLFGEVHRVSIQANDIRTDSVRADFLIPFQVGRLETQMDSLRYHLGEHRTLNVREFRFSSVSNKLEINGVALELDTSWMAISRTLPYHKDIITFTLPRMEINGISMYDIYGDSFRLRANAIILDSLDLDDHRNKMMPEPPQKEKPMFKSMLDMIPYQIDVDTIRINHGAISYTEMPPSGGEPGTVYFSQINGYLAHVTADSVRQQELEQMHSRLNALINQEAALTFDLVVPFDEEKFYLDADIERFDLTILNPTIVPLASVRIDQGNAHQFRLRMDANTRQSRNTLNFDYDNLNLSVLKNDRGSEKKGLLSVLANAFVKSDNDASKGSFSDIEYTTERNIHRSPFNFMWLSIKDGIREIVPSTVGSVVMPSQNKQNKK